ncbi:hypothetical protein [Halorubrum vacuolatum]|uniref:Uncharacterized protein n=1 Tax=Halorubrum vacuolatum TaxID=63740 RepID=A0A238VE64_HALVU|nr:hypothetical protein [Halorubrum vacuolatum]SNR32692.1 hypothetical protein SAMN06264855_102342 [Halorubrum vacuolatum]
MEGNRDEPPPEGGTNDSDVSEGECCRYVIRYHEPDPPMDDHWLLEWCLGWIADPDVRRVDNEQVEGSAPNRLIVELTVGPEECRSSRLRQRLVDRVTERVDAISITCQPIPETPELPGTSRPSIGFIENGTEVSG